MAEIKAESKVQTQPSPTTGRKKAKSKVGTQPGPTTGKKKSKSKVKTQPQPTPAMSKLRPFFREMISLPINHKFESNYWEFPARQMCKDICWLLVLPIIIPAVQDRQTKIIENFLKDINAGQTYTAEDVVQRLGEYNVFLDKHVYYADDIVKHLVSSLSKTIKGRIKMQQYCNKMVLQTFAKIANRRVVVVSYNAAPDLTWLSGKVPDFYGVTTEVYDCKNVLESDVVLFVRGHSQKIEAIYGYGLPEAIGSTIRLDALRKILGLSGKQNFIRKILNGLSIDENFIDFMMKNAKEFLKKVVVESVPVLHHLHNAGVEVAPAKQGKKFRATAFYFAAQDQLLLYHLYEFSANSPSRFQCDYKNLWSVVLSNRKELSTVLKETKQLLKHDESECNLYLTEISEFHEFVTDFQLHLANAKCQFNSNGQFPNLEFEKQLQSFSCLVNGYKRHFYLKNVPPSTNFSLMDVEYKNFSKYRNFFYNLDLSAFLLFYDRCFSLQHFSNSSDEVLRTVSNTFFNYICLQQIFLQNVSSSEGNIILDSKEKTVEETMSSSDYANVAIHLERRKWFCALEGLEQYLKHLANKNMQWAPYEMTVKKISPEVDDHFTLQQLKSYLLTVEKHFEMSGTLENLLILRLIQVLGESTRVNLLRKPSFGQMLLISLLPKDLSGYIHRIRDILSQRTDQNIGERLEVEERKDLFEKAREVLVDILHTVKYVCKLQLMISHEHVIVSSNKCLPNSENTDSLFGSLLRQQKCTEINKKLQLPVPIKTSSSNESEIHYTKEIHESLLLKLGIFHHNTSLKFKTFVRESVPELRPIFENHFTFIQSLIDDQQKEGSQNVEVIRYLLLCLKNSLQFLVDNAFKENKEPDDFVNIYHKLKTKTSNSSTISSQKLEMYKAMYSSILTVIQCSETSNYCLNGKSDSFQEIINLLDANELNMSKKKYEICSRVPQIYKNHHEAKAKMLSSAKVKEKISKIKMDKVFRDLLFDKKGIKSVKEAFTDRNLNLLLKLNDPYGKLLKLFKDDSLSPEDCNALCSKLGIDPESKRQPPLELTPEKIEFKLPNRKALVFLLSRLQLLKELLINSSKLQKMWSTVAYIPKTQICIIHILMQKYRTTPKMQACVEILFMDCVNVSKGEIKQQLEKVVEKMNNCRNGVTLRNMFVYDRDSALFEIIEKSVDPLDLPTEIVSTAVELMKDIETIKMILEVSDKFQSRNLKNCIELEKYNLCWEIKKCSHWKDYVAVLNKVH